MRRITVWATRRTTACFGHKAFIIALSRDTSACNLTQTPKIKWSATSFADNRIIASVTVIGTSLTNSDGWIFVKPNWTNLIAEIVGCKKVSLLTWSTENRRRTGITPTWALSCFCGQAIVVTYLRETSFLGLRIHSEIINWTILAVSVLITI